MERARQQVVGNARLCKTSRTLSEAPATFSQQDPPEVRAGLVLGRYELLTPIASGGMAQVWAARLRGARQFQKIVAVKTMLPKLSEDEQFEQMFLDEASLASQIRHPNAVEILDLGEQVGVLYLVMEWIEGVPLNQLMKAAKPLGGIPYPIAARIALQACAGLHAAHELRDEKGQHVGLVHRDVSPQNLLVTYDGVTKVVDFGVAKATAMGGGATVAGQVKGKVSYMAPEQVNGEGLDRRADVFALGIVLYALTTGKHPFRRESEAATMYNICSPQPAVEPSKVVDDYPKELEPVLMKALAKNRDERYASCDEMLRALDALPAHLRVGSDGDVGAFVVKLLGHKRTEQKRRIDDAINRVESSERASGMWSGAEIHDQELSSRGTMTNDVTGLPTGLHPTAKRNRILGAVGLVALMGAGAVLATGLLRDDGTAKTDGVRFIEAPEQPEPLGRPETTGPSAVTPDELPAEGEVADGANDEEPDESPSSASPQPEASPATTTSPKPKSPAPRPRQAAPSPKPTAQPKPAPQQSPSSDWKYEAGF